MDDDTPDPKVKLRSLFDRYAQLYPSVRPRIAQLLANKTPRIRRRADEMMRIGREHEVGRAKRLAAAFGLTPAETRVALHLIDGGDIASYARETGLSPGTVRSQLKSIFAKTGVTRQAALVRLGHALD
ncbi:MAG TPA: helix-turn-helix transcriptional regulator [Caulobacteraceae bacterium]|jgi:DNA-binding CsgD family transcriptional regulator